MTRWIPPARWLVPLLLAIAIAAMFGACAKAPDTAGDVNFHCPMHPTFLSDRPGDCSICGMRLVPMEPERAGDEGRDAAEDMKYHCPMHPDVVSDSPGDCSICGMPLVPAKAEQAATAEKDPVTPAANTTAGTGTTGDRRILYYRNPMDPSITSPIPAKDAMGMDYVPVYADEVAAPGEVEGHATVRMNEEGMRLTGVRTAAATRGRQVRTIRAVGLVAPDERRVRQVTTKVDGWVEKLHVNFTGQLVEKGSPVLAVYSPELLASQEEYLRAQAAAERFRTSDLPDVRVSGETLLAAARERLRLFDVPERFIEELARTGKPQRAVTLVAPVSGYATSKDVFEGTRVEPGMPLFTVTDLASVWIEADVYEYEASAVRPGQEAAITLPYDPEVRLAGRVTYVYPTLDPESRTLKVRFEASNPRLVLRPGMYANVDLEVDFGEGVIVPADAILDTGTRQLVFVETGSGVFEPREIRVSGRSGDSARVLEGLREGERVAVHANFLLDSESRLRAAIAGMTRKREGGK